MYKITVTMYVLINIQVSVTTLLLKYHTEYYACIFSHWSLTPGILCLNLHLYVSLRASAFLE